MRLGFLTNECLLSGQAGGVQLCTQEFLNLFRAIDPELLVITYTTDQSLVGRLRRRIWPSPYHRLISRPKWQRSLDEIRASAIEVLLLNNSDAFVLAPLLRRALPGLKLVYLSHGPVVTDVVNTLLLPLPEMGGRRRFTANPGRVLNCDILLRRHVHGTISISKSDDSMEAWLGSRTHIWIPRLINCRPLKFRAVPGRIGCVSTLNHAPNYDGLMRVASALDTCGSVTLRLVGGPECIGRQLAQDFASIDYLGPLSEEELASEIISWRAFVNPIFCMARGCSMKVKMALEKGLPVLTTAVGARGYRWDPEALPLSVSAAELAEQTCRVANDETAYRAALAGVTWIAACCETAPVIVARLEHFLQGLEDF